MSVAVQLAGQHVLLQNVSWPTYQALLSDLGDHRRGRLAYDRGKLEIMSPSLAHERFRRVIGRFIEAFTEELGIAVLSAGSTTLQHELRERGVEPDECYFVQNESLVRRRRRLDLSRDPPPDLALEIDVTKSSLDRLEIYAALGVPEVWRYDGRKLTFLQLTSGGKYGAVRKSRALKSLAPRDVMAFLGRLGTVDETRLVRSFRAWVRGRLEPE
ncbi:MAG: Uma2 family endonuclease [Planctomycetes bacterium]|nr:Uma2 family endonuclease [Planctomycetota bacterium]